MGLHFYKRRIAPVKTIGLPVPYDLTKDAVWKEGGDLWVKYDLEIEDRKAGG